MSLKADIVSNSATHWLAGPRFAAMTRGLLRSRVFFVPLASFAIVFSFNSAFNYRSIHLEI